MPDKYKRASITITMPDGTKKTLRFTGKTQKEADAKKAKAKAEYEAGLLVVNGKTTFAAWVEEWLEVYKKPKIAESSYHDIKNMIKRVYGTMDNLKLCDIKLIHIQRCINDIAGSSKSYINKCMMYIKDIFRQAYNSDLIPKDPTIGLVAPQSKESKPRRALTIEEIKLFRHVMTYHHRGAFFGIMLACGLRPGEARALTRYNVDTKNKTITVTNAVENNSTKIKSPKTEAGNRTIPVPDWYWPILEDTTNKAECYLFPNSRGGPMSKQRYLDSWHSFLREMDLAAGARTYRNKVIVHAIAQDLTPYNLRHTYCTNLAEMGVDLKTAQYLMGHSDISVTANIYTHVTNNMINSAREKINRVNAL